MPRSQIVSVQYLRGCAAMLVVLYHAQDQFPAFRAMLPTDIGAYGVDIFFVISGFVMTHTSHQRNWGAGEFLMRRIVRIVPLYWIITALTAVLLIAMPHAVRHSEFAGDHFVKSLLFLPHENPGLPNSLSPMVKLGWTLNYEMLFYVLFAAFIALPPIRRTMMISAVLMVLILLAAMFSPAPAPLRFWGNSLVLEFILGCVVAHFYDEGYLHTVGVRVWIGSIAVATAAMIFSSFALVGLARVLVAGVPAAILVAACVGLEAQANRPWRSNVLHFIGDASYSIYLAHLYAVIAMRIVWDKAALPTTGVLPMLEFIGACLLTGIGLGCVTYRAVEVPATTWARNRLKSATLAAARAP